MSDRERKRLKEIHTFPALVKYLRDDLRWPVEQESFEDLDEITFDWEADELGIDPDHAAKIEYIKQLRPLESGEPQGVFFVKFNAKSLPVVALRRLLGKLVVKKRATADAAERPLWAMRDLVFISSYGTSDERQLSFAYFQEPELKAELPTLKVLGWDDHDTALQLDRVHDQLAAHLTWPTGSKALPAWRKGWSAAFELRHGEIVTTARELAEQLAALARGIRARANQLLQLETEKGPLRTLMAGFKTALIHDLTEDQFADMYAQTIAYGLLSARITHPDPVKAETLPDLIPVTNPFLKELMETFVLAGGKQRGRKRGLHLDFDELGISDVVELLRRANMDAVLRNFGADDRREDPVTYFYEDFLNAYDAKERKRRGVYYTPKPVVSYIVRSVHKILQVEFNIEDGLASTITWEEMAARHKSLKIPDNVKSDAPFVQILDPATGTATFLVTVIEVIFETMMSKWNREGRSEESQSDAWNAYVPAHLLPRLYGYELMMAPYAIAHLKIGLKLFETGYRFASNERARIYLTNTLEPASDAADSQIDALSEALAHEAAAVNAVKKNRRFTAVMGNPPYSALSANLTTTARAIVDRYKFIGAERLIEKGALQFEKNLQDDYVKFFAWAEGAISASDVGVLSLICNNGFLDTPTLRGMRWHLLKTFSLLMLLDLHGSTKRAVPGDENVFDIQQGVAVSILARPASPRQSVPTVRRAELKGLRVHKYDWLSRSSVSSTDWTDVTPLSPLFQFLPLDSQRQGEYLSYPSIVEVMPFYSTGSETGFDALLVDFSADELCAKLSRFLDPHKTDAQIKLEFSVGKGTSDKLLKIRKSFRADFEKRGRQYCKTGMYRVFDSRSYYFKKEYLKTNSENVMQHISQPGNVALVVFRQQSQDGFHHVFITDKLSDKNAVSLRTREVNYYFPLYMMPQSGGLRLDSQKSPNLSPAFLSDLQARIIARDSTTPFPPNAIIPEQALGYIYANLHSLGYRTRYADFLKSDFPRIPIPASLGLFLELSQLGTSLIALHLLDAAKLNAPITTYVGPRNPEVGRVGWSHNTVWLDAEATKKGQHTTAGAIGFEGVSEAVWNFQIGGYQVCEKWLKDRKGRKLLKADIEHYQKIIVALSETIEIMKQIDEVIDKYGGWPGAFQTVPIEAVARSPNQ